jgi:hypothetical protein
VQLGAPRIGPARRRRASSIAMIPNEIAEAEALLAMLDKLLKEGNLPGGRSSIGWSPPARRMGPSGRHGYWMAEARGARHYLPR